MVSQGCKALPQDSPKRVVSTLLPGRFAVLALLGALLSLSLSCATEEEEAEANPQHLEWAQQSLDSWGIGLRTDLIDRERGSIRNWITVADSNCRAEGVDDSIPEGCFDGNAVGICYVWWNPATSYIQATTLLLSKDFLEDPTVSDASKLAVFIHEVGHCLGLQHSDEPKLVFDLPDNIDQGSPQEYTFARVYYDQNGRERAVNLKEYNSGLFLTTCGEGEAPSPVKIKEEELLARDPSGSISEVSVYTFGGDALDTQKCLMLSYSHDGGADIPHAIELEAIQNTYSQGEVSRPPTPAAEQFYQFMQYSIGYSADASLFTVPASGYLDFLAIESDGGGYDYFSIENTMHYDPPSDPNDCEHYCDYGVIHHRDFPDFYISGTIGNARVVERDGVSLLDSPLDQPLEVVNRSDLVRRAYVIYADGREDRITDYPDGSRKIRSGSFQKRALSSPLDPARLAIPSAGLSAGQGGEDR